MKFARIDIETVGFVNKKDKFLINFGDHLQNIIIKDLYKKMEIDEDEIYVLNNYETSKYDGEYLVLPINHVISRNLSEYLSPKIIPVFIGISRDTSAITEKEIEYLKKYSPIGCRDQETFDYLNKNHVECYLNGCLSITLDRREKIPENEKVFVIDAPQYAIDAMPNNKKNKAVFMQNTHFGTYEELTKDNNLEKIVREQYKMLKNEATLVITSRLHIASPCIAMGIPVILVRNSIDYRYSWIDKFIPIYKEIDVESINWNPEAVEDIEDFKEKLVNNAIMLIKKTKEKYESILEISDFYERRNKVQYELPQFSQKVIDFVDSNWDKDCSLDYAIWGENDASERLYTYLTNNYPNARYVAFYDSYKKITYHGKEAQHPSKIVCNDNTFIFVTGYTATDAAKELFEKIGKKKEQYFLFESCVRDNK